MRDGLLTRKQHSFAAPWQALKDSLPCHWGSACAVRVDEGAQAVRVGRRRRPDEDKRGRRIHHAGCSDHMRVCILGAVGTPYESGANVFVRQ